MKYCNEHLNDINKKNKETTNLIASIYNRDDVPWYLGYSGGKDSTTLLVLVINALLNLKKYHKEVNIIYCDTGVEIPTITKYVYDTIESIKKEIEFNKLPIKIKIAQPIIDDRFFVKVIGRGYPTPTNIFRWCTNRLRINPVNKIINSTENAIILLGVRKGESPERNRIIDKHSTNNEYFLNQNNNSKRVIFSPIINYNLRDIWSTLMYNKSNNFINFMRILELYKDAGSECPIYREEKGIPCGKGRFGCWTCTVIRKDTSVSSMIKSGYKDLEPLFLFRNWLAQFRDNKEYRSHYRRNGKKGLGPITLKGRKLILKKLLQIQEKNSINIINNLEIERIKYYWKQDKKNLKYREI